MSLNRCTASAILLIGVSIARHADAFQVEALDSLGGLQSAAGPLGITWAATAEKPSPSRIISGEFDPSGTFVLRDYREGAVRSGKRWDELPWYFVSHDGTTLFVAEGPIGAMFQTHKKPDMLEVAPGPVQWLYCPWPELSHYIKWLREASDLEISRTAEGWRARSGAAELAVEWSEDRLTRIVRGTEDGGGYQAVVFSEFGKDGLPGWLPSRMREVLHPGVERDGKPIHIETSFELAAFRSSGVSVAFDPVRLDSGKYDAASGEVYSPTGERLYNLRDLEAQLEGRGAWATWRWVACGAVGVIIAGCAWWRLRSRGAG